MSIPDFLGYTYCPVRELFRSQLTSTLQQQAGHEQYQMAIPNGHKGDDQWKQLHQETDCSKLPEVITAAGYGGYFSQDFRDNFLDQAVFSQQHAMPSASLFTDAGLVDPEGYFHVYAAFPLVFMVDESLLGSRPKPRVWADLLNPCYANSIAIGATQDQVHEDILLYIHQTFGDFGLQALAANMKSGMHGAMMAKQAGTNNGAAIYLCSWLFASCCNKRNRVSVYWPDDGAIITPMFALLKSEHSHISQALFNTVTGEEYGQQSANNRMPAASTLVDNKLPENAKLKWLGWDYIQQHDMPELVAHVGSFFMAHLPTHFVMEG